ncbi:uncharacterized protein LOC143299025 [Babylonia areolata]|uniref:uncharacterized protein LOC143299025 n=1 Tax=Babylonia areolata TaxID=304850 RepID=UPI003FD3C057
MSKVAWPELTGRPWQEASSFIRKEFPNIMVQVVRSGMKAKPNERPDRVRIFVDSDGKVTQTPIIG